MLKVDAKGLYCAGGDFYIDPWLPVERALITHAHSDHARAGSQSYLCPLEGKTVLAQRLGKGANISGIPYGEKLNVNGVQISFHPAGHVLGSAQIRLEHGGEIWVVSGDYKRQLDPTCAPFEPIRCHTFITECTFGLPVYRWQDTASVFKEINQWWADNQSNNRTSVLFAYSLGKAQRLLAGIDGSTGPVFVHDAVAQLLPAYESAGVRFPQIETDSLEHRRACAGRALVIAPPAVDGASWLKPFGDYSTAFASGWMLIRGTRRRLNADRGFVISDHADWPDLLRTIRETGAQRILATHGNTSPLVRWLNENGWQAESLSTRFEGEEVSKEEGE